MGFAACLNDFLFRSNWDLPCGVQHDGLWFPCKKANYVDDELPVDLPIPQCPGWEWWQAPEIPKASWCKWQKAPGPMPKVRGPEGSAEIRRDKTIETISEPWTLQFSYMFWGFSLYTAFANGKLDFMGDVFEYVLGVESWDVRGALKKWWLFEPSLFGWPAPATKLPLGYTLRGLQNSSWNWCRRSVGKIMAWSWKYLAYIWYIYI